jgi:hypothetical protein
VGAVRVWNDRPARRPVVGDLNHYEEMDVCLSLREYREFFDSFNSEDTQRSLVLLSGDFVLEPWVRIRMADDWFLTAGIEVTRDEEDDGG